MFGVARVGVDTAGGGLINTNRQDMVTIDGRYVAVTGDGIAPHGSHVGATISQGSTFVTINGIPVSFKGNLATCGHTIDTGSDWVLISE